MNTAANSPRPRSMSRPIRNIELRIRPSTPPLKSATIGTTPRIGAVFVRGCQESLVRPPNRAHPGLKLKPGELRRPRIPLKPRIIAEGTDIARRALPKGGWQKIGLAIAIYRSHTSIRSLLPKGICYNKIRRTRPAVRHIAIDPRSHKRRDKYDAIVDRLGAMADKEENGRGVIPRLNNSRCAHCVVLGCAKRFLALELTARSWKHVSANRGAR